MLNGKVLFDSEKHINLPPQKRKIGYLFQDYALFPNMTVEENIGIGIEKKRRKEEVARFVKMFFLEGFEKNIRICFQVDKNSEWPLREFSFSILR